MSGWSRLLRRAVHLLPLAVLVSASPHSLAQGLSGTTLAAYKTLDICEVTPGGIWRYSGLISLWNEGVVDTDGLSINDHIQNKTGKVWVDQYFPTITLTPSIIPAGTTQETAITYPYTYDGAALAGDIRNVATITILNHSGSLGTPKGPEPKATYTGTRPPPPCETTGPGCVRTQGYWDKKPGVIWPEPYSRDATFFLSGQTWQQVLRTPVSDSPGYYQLADQYIAAVLNQASGASVPLGVANTLQLAYDWFNLNAPSACVGKGSLCGLQKDWAKVLDDYNNGNYPGGPPHCGDDDSTAP